MKSEIFLPIGSVVKADSHDGLFMVNGYNCFNYENNSISKYDYSVIHYPQGASYNDSFGINKEQVIEIIFIGFKGANYEAFVETVKAFNVAASVKTATTPILYMFDENGIVISDNSETKNPFISEPIKFENKKIDSNPDKWPIFDGIEFDSNGIIVSDNSNSTKTEGLKFDSNGVVIEDLNADNDATDKKDTGLKFDSNGVVTEDNALNPVKITVPEIKFDENGVVLDDGSASKTPTYEYKFDASGNIIKDGSIPDLPKDTSLASNVKFDADGFVIMDEPA